MKKLVNRILQVVLLCILIVTTNQCKKDDGNPSDGDNNVPSTTKVITDEDFESGLISYDTLSGRLLMKKEFITTDLKPGNILISSFGDGLLRQVTSVTYGADEVSIETTQASISDAITKGMLTYADELLPSQVMNREYFMEGIVDKTNFLKDSEKTDYHVAIDVILIDIDNNPLTVSDQIRASGDFIFDPNVSIDAEFNNGLDYFKFNIGFVESLELMVNCSFLTEIQMEKMFMLYKFKKKIIMIGGAPVVIRPVIKMYIGALLDGPIQLNAGFSQAYTQNYTIEYKNSAWYDYKEPTQKTFNWITPSINNSVQFTPYIRPEFYFEFYGVVAPYVGLKGYADIIANLNSTPWWELYLGYNASMGVEMKVFDRVLVNFEKVMLEDRFKVAEANSDNQPPLKPNNPIPSNNATNTPISLDLNWDCSDPDQDDILYDVYFGVTPAPDLIIDDITANEFSVGNVVPLEQNRTYYWKVVAKDEHSHSTEGDLWSFTTSGGSTGNTLIAWYPFSGDANDYSGNNFDGTVYGALMTSDIQNQPNSAYQFNGSSNYIEIPSLSVNNLPTGTVTAFIYLDGLGKQHTILDKTITNQINYFQFIVDNNNALRVMMEGAVLRSNTSLALNQWYHVAFTWDGNNGIFYLNGQEDGIRTCTKSVRQATRQTFIGKVDNNTAFTKGKLDEVRIYNYALSASEIATLAGNVNPTEKGAYYPFNGNMNDESGNGNNGENHGASFIADRFGNQNSALQFNGTSAYVLVPKSPSLAIDDNISVCFWIKKGNNNISASVPISKRNASDQQIHWIVMLRNSDGASFQYSGVGANSPYYDYFYPTSSPYNILNDGDWHFVVFCHEFGSRNNDKLYIDSNPYNIEYMYWHSSFDFPAYTDCPMKFGCQSNIGFYNGCLDDVRIVNKILTTSEIESLYLSIR